MQNGIEFVNVKKTNILLLLYFQVKDIGDGTYSRYIIQHIYDFDTIAIVGDIEGNRICDALPFWIEDAIKNKTKIYNPTTLPQDITIACDYINCEKAREYLVELHPKPIRISILNPQGYKLEKTSRQGKSFNDLFSFSIDSVEYMDKKINNVEKRNPRGLNWDMGYSLLFNPSKIKIDVPNIKLRYKGPNHFVFAQLKNNAYVFVLKHFGESNKEAINRLFKRNVTIEEYEIGYLLSVWNSDASWVEYTRVRLIDSQTSDLKGVKIDEKRFVSLPRLVITYI